jgi:hypothetical protein
VSCPLFIYIQKTALPDTINPVYCLKRIGTYRFISAEGDKHVQSAKVKRPQIKSLKIIYKKVTENGNFFIILQNNKNNKGENFKRVLRAGQV